VSTASWTLNQARLEESLASWRRDHSPDEEARRLVREWLLFLELEPLGRGREDSEHPGIWFGRVTGTNVGVTYVPDADTHVVYVTMIA
jgi:hypothetical protein